MKHASHISPQELQRWNSALDELEWTESRLAKELGTKPNVIWGWRVGKHPIPKHAWAFVELAIRIKRAYDPLKPCANWRTHGRGNPKHRERMDAQALQRFRDAGKL